MPSVYVSVSAWDPNLWVLEKLSDPNPRVVGLAIWNELDGAYEDPAWLQLEIIDGVETITVNQPIKASILQQRFDDEMTKEAQKQADKDAKQLLKDAVSSYKKADITDIQSIKDQFQIIIDLLLDVIDG